jgi:secreted Zn-dependent insulinase-like peptidase
MSCNSSGSWETLETKPKERGLDIRLELLKFYENYSANLMHLVVYGKGKYYSLVNFGIPKPVFLLIK